MPASRHVRPPCLTALPSCCPPSPPPPRVASLLGAGAAPAARACGIAALVWGACAAGAVGGALWVWRGAVGWLFTGASGGALVELVEGIVPLVALCQVGGGGEGGGPRCWAC